MAVTYESTRTTGFTSVLLTYSSDLGGTPLFYLYQNGVLVSITTATQWTFTVEAGVQIQIEVFDADTTPSAVYPGRMTLTWDEAAATSHYVIEEFVDAAWTERAQVVDQGESYFSWVSRFLEDVTSHQFRVTPVGTNGVAGPQRAFTALMVRYPDVPDVSYTYDSDTAKVTIVGAS